MTEWASKQPKAGDTVLHCGHVGPAMSAYYFEGGAVHFSRPDGSDGLATFYMECHACGEQRHGGDFQPRGDGIWQGDAPAIKEIPPEDRPKHIRGW